MVIDDHIGAQVLTREEFEKQPTKRDTEVFEIAGRAYQQKRNGRGAQHGVFLGAEVDGDKGV
jgi:hypothetical protein